MDDFAKEIKLFLFLYSFIFFAHFSVLRHSLSLWLVICVSHYKVNYQNILNLIN